jgi:hypothetical protein
MCSGRWDILLMLGSMRPAAWDPELRALRASASPQPLGLYRKLLEEREDITALIYITIIASPLKSCMSSAVWSLVLPVVPDIAHPHQSI